MQQHTIQTPYMVGEVHIYTAEIGGELVLFDTGPCTTEGMAYLENHIDLKRLSHVFVTHCHVDHYGLARFIQERSGAEIHIPYKDALKLRHHERRLALIERELEAMGFDRSYIRGFRQVVEQNGVFPGAPRRYRVVEESGEAERLGIGVLPCPGHSQSDLVYLVKGHAVTGDTLLRGIFQAPLLDIDLDTFSGRFSNYRAYCATLLRLQELRGYTILPGHRQAVEGLEQTILFYVGKLLERSTRLIDFPAELPVPQLIDRLFGDTLADPFVTYLKASEIAFMRDFLSEPQRLRHSLEATGLFAPVSSAFARVA